MASLSSEQWERDAPILCNFLLHREQVPAFRGIGTTVADMVSELATLGLYRQRKEALAFIQYLADEGQIFPTIDAFHYLLCGERCFTLSK
jgi:hypothetical protein